MAQIENLAGKKFVVNGTVQKEVMREIISSFINKALKPQTAAYLGSDISDAHGNWPAMKAAIEAAGTKIVYEEFVPLDNSDYSSYLNKIKYAEPEVLYLYSGSNEMYLSVAKQIMELGGWGDIKVITTSAGEAARNMPGAQGWYMFANWAPGLDYPGAVKFYDEYQAMFGRAPTSSHVYYYNCMWTAIYAVNLAGTDTDRVAIAQAARSGKLEWDTPMGHAHFSSDGTSGLGQIIEQIKDGKLVLVPMPD